MPAKICILVLSRACPHMHLMFGWKSVVETECHSQPQEHGRSVECKGNAGALFPLLSDFEVVVSEPLFLCLGQPDPLS